MYEIKTELEISAAHQLDLDYESPCSNLHGHNWRVVIHCVANELNQNGMVADFAHIKSKIKKQFDHRFLNEVFPLNPTAENIARYIGETLNADKTLLNPDHGAYCNCVEVEETPGNIASWSVVK